MTNNPAPAATGLTEAAREALEALDVFESAYKRFSGSLPDGFPADEFRKVAGAGEPLRAALSLRTAPPIPESPWKDMSSAPKNRLFIVSVEGEPIAQVGTWHPNGKGFSVIQMSGGKSYEGKDLLGWQDFPGALPSTPERGSEA